MSEQVSILIVDDDINFANTLNRILSHKGYNTATADNGARAIDMIVEKSYDVVLMDIKMPVMSGIEAHKKIKAIRPGTTVILMTAFSVDDFIRDAVKLGAYAIIRKPFEIETVVNLIEKSKNGLLLAVVDDDPNIRKTMKTALENKGFGVCPCSSGEEAVSLAKDCSCNVFFIDLKLPVLNGLETYLEIKKVNPEAIVIMMTAYRQEADELIKQSIEKGAYSCLYKPFDITDAINIVEEIYKKRQR